jgi:CRISPR-associated protein Csx10
MGSVFVYTIPNLEVDKLSELEMQGIGERRAEGFGRVGVNWHMETRWRVQDADDFDYFPLAITDATSRTIAERMVERMLRRRLDAALTRRANELGSLIKRPKRSQLSRVRKIIQNALRQTPDEGRPRLNGYLSSLNDRKTTRNQFTGERLADRATLVEWLQERVADQDKIWDEIGIDSSRPTQLGADVIANRTGLAYEYNLRFMDAVLARAAKRQSEEG